MSIESWTGSLLQISGLAGGLLAVLDWVLTPPQKAKLKGAAETAWIWLDDRKIGPYVEFISSQRAQRRLMWVISGIFAFTIVSFLPLLVMQRQPQEEDFQTIIWELVLLENSLEGMVTMRPLPTGSD